MAEAAVETPSARFFCHKCSQELPEVLSDYTCPHCLSGFIEELNNPPESARRDSSADYEVPQQGLLLEAGQVLLSNLLQQLENTTDESAASREQGAQRPPQRRAHRMVMHTSGSNTMGDILGDPWHIFQNLALQFQGQGMGNMGRVSLFFGEPGDYVWGREGFDAIITQLLNQMDGAGPPPMPRKKIDEVPITHISQEQVNSNLQCSVCWDDFQLNEPVRKLVCEHVYHEKCIIPWLELHATCPVCRKSLHDGDPDTNGAQRLRAQNAASQLAALIDTGTARANLSAASSSSQPGTSGSSSSSSSAPGSSSSSSGRPPTSSYMDMDFD